MWAFMVLKCGVVRFVFGGEAEALYAFDQDFLCFGLGLEELHDFGDEVGQRHGSRVGGAVHQSVWT